MRRAKSFDSVWRCSVMPPSLAVPTGPYLSSAMEKGGPLNETIHPGWGLQPPHAHSLMAIPRASCLDGQHKSMSP